MIIGAPKELLAGEARVAMTPESAKALQKLGYDCQIETGAGVSARFQDTDYEAAGVTVAACSHRPQHVVSGDIVGAASDILNLYAPTNPAG